MINPPGKELFRWAGTQKFDYWYQFSLLKNEFQKPKKLKESL
jgi:hypothetical protein